MNEPIKIRPYSVAQTRYRYSRKVSMWSRKLWAETLPEDTPRKLTYRMLHNNWLKTNKAAGPSIKHAAKKAM